MSEPATPPEQPSTGVPAGPGVKLNREAHILIANWARRQLAKLSPEEQAEMLALNDEPEDPD